jgi:hypothetical protein
MLKSLLIKCTVFSLVLSSLHPQEEQIAIERVVRQAYSSIARIEEGKIFLKPERLILKSGKIYIEDVNGAEFAIPAVFSSEDIPPYMQVGDSTIFNMWKCQCGTWNHKWDHPTHCWHCGLPR